MTKEQALDLLFVYQCDFKDGEEDILAEGLDQTILTELSDRFPDDGSENKAMRWLGFAQGAAWALGFYSLDELKEHSRKVAGK